MQMQISQDHECQRLRVSDWRIIKRHNKWVSLAQFSINIIAAISNKRFNRSMG